MLKLFKITFVSIFLLFVTSIVHAQEISFENNEVVLKESSYKLNAIDPTPISNLKGSSYPGLRGANQMIMYTSKFGLRTNTNEFGAEAIIENNTVVSLSGADSIIPYNGFVISGHGSAKTWINKNLTVGTKVFIDEQTKTLKAYLTTESYLYEANEKIREAQELVKYYKKKNRHYNWELPTAHIKDAMYFVKKAGRKVKYIQEYSHYAIEAANLALKYAIPYDKDELKVFWIRPTETTMEQVVSTVEKIKSAGINEIFLETYFHGMTIFPSKTMADYGFYPQNPTFASCDILKAYIDEAHKRNMKVSIWFESFYIGNKNPKDYPRNILALRPEWANVNRANYDSKTPVASSSEHNGYFLDPANPDVQMFLELLITEIIDTYNPDGINLDYVRYPQSLSPKYSTYVSSNWGYTTYARADFMKKYGKDPVELEYNDNLWMFWDKYRQDRISAFILRIHEITKKKGVHLTAVIFPDKRRTLETKQQDWSTWALTNSLDGVTPLLLTCDEETTESMVNDILKNTSPSTKVYAGLFTTFMNGSQEDLLRQIHVSRQMKTSGVILFDFAHLTDKYINTLNTCVFNPNPQKEFTNKQKLKQNKRNKKEKQ